MQFAFVSARVFETSRTVCLSSQAKGKGKQCVRARLAAAIFLEWMPSTVTMRVSMMMSSMLPYLVRFMPLAAVEIQPPWIGVGWRWEG